jgi:hypothetical protein
VRLASATPTAWKTQDVALGLICFERLARKIALTRRNSNLESSTRPRLGREKSHLLY